MKNEKIWAPWRLAYVQGQDRTEQERQPVNLLPGGDPQCFMCRSAADPHDRHNRVVHRGRQAMTMLNRYPYTNGHLLVAPLGHVARLDELVDATQLELAQMIAQMVAVLEKTLHPDGFNIGLNLGRAAGAGLPGHLHWHIVPRWNGDTSFMPTVAGVNVIPQSLEALWELLVQELGGSHASRQALVDVIGP